ncbi:unnamed protein product [Protopolystoma xenopodis]|uniref:Uncharacterized protein n=1 Tax=Protopolystoma xenopodis TaxID=117903 RepID=A0A448XGU2_9PLAT|nr:unnamed protein product [Protopolystoma xenopodis]
MMLRLAGLTDDVGETSLIVPSLRSDSENNHAFYEFRMRCVPIDPLSYDHYSGINHGTFVPHSPHKSAKTFPDMIQYGVQDITSKTPDLIQSKSISGSKVPLSTTIDSVDPIAKCTSSEMISHIKVENSHDRFITFLREYLPTGSHLLNPETDDWLTYLASAHRAVVVRQKACSVWQLHYSLDQPALEKIDSLHSVTKAEVPSNRECVESRSTSVEVSQSLIGSRTSLLVSNGDGRGDYHDTDVDRNDGIEDCARNNNSGLLIV